jgi:hypothetical protein
LHPPMIVPVNAAITKGDLLALLHCYNTRWNSKESTSRCIWVYCNLRTMNIVGRWKTAEFEQTTWSGDIWIYYMWR